MKTTSSSLRVGVIDFINSYPLFYPMRSQKVPSHCEFVIGSPVEINAMLANKEIDIGLISSASYLENRSSYILLSDLGIGARKKVLSVCLFAREPNFDFTKAHSFLIPSHSATSARLLKVLSFHFWKNNATFLETNIPDDELFEQDLPFLLIGDTCLQRRHTAGSIADLALEWHKASNMSFVFSLVATPNDTFIAKQEEVLHFHKNLMQSYNWSKEHPEEIIKISSSKVQLPERYIEEYFQALDYELLQEHIHGLDHFATMAV